MAGPIATTISGKYAKEAAKKAAQLAEQQKKASLQLINEMDFEPMYASSQVPTYQRTQSPVARSYIDSFLMGNNPDAIMKTAPNAQFMKARAQQSQNSMFGTPQERLAQQNAYRASTPWQVTPPTRPVKAQTADAAAAGWTAQNTGLAGAGMDKDLADVFKAGGYSLDAPPPGTKENLSSWSQRALAPLITESLLQEYGGDKQRLAADIQAAGGVENLLRQKKKK